MGHFSGIFNLKINYSISNIKSRKKIQFDRMTNVYQLAAIEIRSVK